MERSNTIVTWLNDFKLAIIKKEFERIDLLLDTLPVFDTLDQMYQAQALISEALVLFENRKHRFIQDMKKIRQTKKYVQS